MTIERQNMTRVFLYAGIKMIDPDTTMTPIAVRDFYAGAGRPELSSAEVRGPELVGNEMQYTLHRAVGTKGLQPNLKDLDIGDIEASHSLTAAIDKFSAKNRVKADAKINGLLKCLGANGDGACIQPPAQAVRWFF